MLCKLPMTIFIQILFSLYSEAKLFDPSASITSTTELKIDDYHTSCEERDAPIDIFLNQTKFEDTLKKLIYHVDIYGEATSTNNGNGLYISVKKKGTGFSLSGGALGKDRYFLHAIEIIWTKDGKGRCASAFDGQGPPMNVVEIYHNPKCGPIEKAKDTFNCILIVFVGIHVIDNDKPNSRFSNFETNVLKHIKNINTNTSSNYLEKILWFVPDKEADVYYIYCANFRDSYGTHYTGATIMHTALDPNLYITKKQFDESFPTVQTEGSLQKPLEPNNGLVVKQYKGMEPSLDNFEFVPDEL